LPAGQHSFNLTFDMAGEPGDATQFDFHYHIDVTVAESPPANTNNLPSLSPWSQLALMAGLLGAGLGVWRWRGTSSSAA